MIRPECEQILSLAEEYQIIPVCKEIYADMMTPISMLLRLSAVGERYFLLESVEGGEKWGRYSFLGCDAVLRDILKQYKAPRLPECRPLPEVLWDIFPMV